MTSPLIPDVGICVLFPDLSGSVLLILQDRGFMTLSIFLRTLPGLFSLCTPALDSFAPLFLVSQGGS